MCTHYHCYIDAKTIYIVYQTNNVNPTEAFLISTTFL